MLNQTDSDDLKTLISDQIKEVGCRHGVFIEHPSFLPSYLIYTPPGHYPLTFGNVQSHYSPVTFKTKYDNVRTSQSIISFTVADSKLSIRLKTLVIVYSSSERSKANNVSRLFSIDLCKDDLISCLEELYSQYIKELDDIICDALQFLSI